MHAWEQIQQTIEWIETHLDQNIEIEELVFSSHEHFFRTFKQTFGITPDEGVPLITEGIVLEINRRQLKAPVRFTGMKADAPVSFIDGLGTESGADPLDTLWRTFHERKEKDLGLDRDSEEIGVTLPCAKEGHFTYFAGGRTDTASICISESFNALVMDVLYKAEQYLFGTWMPGHKLQSGHFCAERYKSHIQETTAMEVWLKAAE